MRELTGRQRQLMNFIEDYLNTHGFPPSIREMADHMGIRSTNGVNDHLKALEKKGYITREKSLKSRAITVSSPKLEKFDSENEEAMVAVPVLGRVAAGVPVLSEENYEGIIHLGQSLLPSSGKVFALKVRGESMIGKGILEGDTVLVRSQQSANSGDLVVAMVDGEATVKTFRRNKESIRFEPANPDFEPIVLGRQDFRQTSILGVVTGLVRQFP
jgi:repressor LexA